jgi:hypothetical protein
MGRLVGFILIFAVFLTFIVFNLDNSCVVNFGFITTEPVPVFITAFISFFLGMICAVPFFASFSKRKKQLPGASVSEKKGAAGKKLPEDHIQGQDGPYGVD